MTRRDFCLGAAAVATGVMLPCGGRGATAAPRDKKRWYKGNLHCHTYWSDGRAFPDQAIREYRDAGYDFCAVTDHNRMGENRDFWRKVEPTEGGWPPLVCRRNFDVYRKEFPWADVRERNGATEVRLQTLTELIERYAKPGEFLVMRGVEITRNFSFSRGSYNMHMNYVNLDKIPEDIEKARLIQEMPGCKDVCAMIRDTRKRVRDLAASLGNPPHVCFFNHPHWRYYDAVAQDLIDNPDVRFFEVCNTGADFPPVGLLPDDGLYNDRFWDAINATRAKAGQPLLYAVANDDCHIYPCTKTEKPCTFGEAYNMVRADALTPAALFEAMEKGDSYASCGVDLEDVQFDGRTLHVAVSAKKGVAYTIKFITTKRSADTEVVQTVALPQKGPVNKYESRPARTVPIYSSAIGATVKNISGKKGDRVAAEYNLAEDDLYVRARVESDERAPYYVLGGKGAMHPKVAMAWTQPYQKN
ncbi:MAG: hypothetical protein IKC14_06455 [Kiritimatiellae bacterium]|nr:hypothetical protein [Kiritimatiellia bacterium]